MKRIILASFLVVYSATSVLSEEPFHDLSYEEACKKAEKDGKVVMIDFYTTWCGPCKMLDRTTWKNKDVQAWLAEKTVALKIDAEKQRKLARKFKVAGYPTILLLKSDGKEIDRLVGYRDAEKFLSEGKDALAGKNSVVRAKEKLKGNEKNPMDRMDYARVLKQKGKHKEALKEYLWCFDHGNEHRASFSGVRLSFLLRDIVDLGRAYPAAIDALKERRDTVEEILLKITSEKKEKTFEIDASQKAADFAALNRVLEDNEKTLEMFDKLRGGGETTAAMRRIMFREVLDLLHERKRYEDILTGAEDVFAKVDEKVSLYRSVAQRHGPSDYFKKQVLLAGGKYYEALIGAGRKESAKKMADKLLKFEESGRLYAILVEHAARANAMVTARQHVSQAEQSLSEEEFGKVQAVAKGLPGES